MAARPIGQAIRSALRVVSGDGPLADPDLVERFATRHDEAAFESLLWRHGPMVLGVCRRVLPCPQDAEDAFQATFLVLARRAHTLANRAAVGSWLYQVAYRAALKARGRAVRFPRTGLPLPDRPGPAGEPDLVWRDLRPVLDEELGRLPEKYRAALVLHYLEGKTVGQTARELGCPEGTACTRLARGRDLLRSRLTRRGIALAAVALSATLARHAAADTLPAALALSATSAARLPAAVAVSANATAVARAVLHAMAYTRLKVAAVVVALGMLASGGALLAYRAAPGAPAKEAAPTAARPEAGEKKAPAADAHGDALPPGAVARLGTFRLRHGAAVRAVAFSPDGKRLASAGADWLARVWDPASGRLLYETGGGNGPLLGLAFSTKGRRLVTVSESRDGQAVRVWDAATGRPRPGLRDKAGDLNAIALSPDGDVLATAARDGSITLWDLPTGKRLRRLAGHRGGTRVVAFAPGGKMLVSGGADGHLREWAVATGKELRHAEAHVAAVIALAFSPDGKMLASAGLDNTLACWEEATLREQRRAGGLGTGVLCLAFARDGKALIAGDRYGAVRTWDATTLRERRRFTGSNGSVFCVAVSPDGKTIASGGQDYQVRLWDAASGRERHRPAEGHRGPVYATAFSPDGRLLATGGHDRAVCLWDVAGRKQRWRTEGHTAGVEGVAFAPDGKTLASADWNGTVALWDVATGRERRRVRGHAGGVHAVAFAPDSKTLATAGSDQTVRLWDVATGNERRHLAGHKGKVDLVAYSPDGRFLVSAAADKTVRVWAAATGAELYAVPCTTDPRKGVAVSPDGRNLAVAREDGALCLWELATGKQRARLPLKERVIAIAFSPCGRRLVWSEAGLAIRVWDLAAGGEVCRFRGHRSWSLVLALSPNGKTLASGGADGTVLLWDTAAALKEEATAKLSAARLRQAWDALNGEGAAAAYQAVRALAGDPAQSLPLVKRHLRPGEGPDTKRLAKLIADLDSDEFPVREAASEELAKLGGAAEPALRKALDGSPSAEVRLRVRRLLEVLRVGLPSRAQVCRLRMLEVLEWAGTAQARRLLTTLSRNEADPWLAREARAATVRLARRPVRTP